MRACSALADCMRLLTKLDIDSSSADYVATAFEAARHLLSIFSAGDAIAALRRGQVIQVAIGIAKVEMANRERVDGKGLEMGFKG